MGKKKTRKRERRKGEGMEKRGGGVGVYFEEKK